MTELSPEAKKLLELARDEFSPADQRVRAVRSALEVRIRMANGGGGGGASGGALGLAKWGASHWIGIGLVALGLGGLLIARDQPRPSASDRAIATAAAKVAAAPSLAAQNVAAAPHDRDPPQEQPVADSSARSLPVPSDHARALANVAARSTLASKPRPSTLPPRARNAASARSAVSARESGPAHASGTSERTVSGTNAAAPEAQLESATKPPTAQPAANDAEAQPTEAVRTRADDSLAREIALLKSARAALDRHDPATALALADEHAAQFAHGTMRQEQLATRVLALCALNRRADAVAAKRELERTAPRSPHLMQLRASCANEPMPAR